MKKLKKAISIVLTIALINATVPQKAVEASFISDLFGGLFTIITAPIWIFCQDNPTFRKNNPFRKKLWQEIAEREEAKLEEQRKLNISRKPPVSEPTPTPKPQEPEPVVNPVEQPEATQVTPSPTPKPTPSPTPKPTPETEAKFQEDKSQDNNMFFNPKGRLRFGSLNNYRPTPRPSDSRTLRPKPSLSLEPKPLKERMPDVSERIFDPSKSFKKSWTYTEIISIMLGITIIVGGGTALIMHYIIVPKNNRASSSLI